MNQDRYDDVYYQELLYNRLPALYRARDREQELKRFLDLFGHEFGRVRGNLDQLWLDFFIDSCQDWVIPYIGDLVGTHVLFNDQARNRVDVKNTIRWRRQKGTLAGLEDIAAAIPQWGAHAVEMFERLLWSQNLNHIRPHAVQAVPLDQPSRVARVGTPFELEGRSVDLRAPDHRVGWHQLRNLDFFLWSIPDQPWEGAVPVSQPAQPGPDPDRFRFHPLDLDTALYAGGDKGGACADIGQDVATRAGICFAHADSTPIRGRDFHDNPGRYFGQPVGFSVYEDGILLCRTQDTAPSQSLHPALAFEELSPSDGLLVADQGLFGAGAVPFRIEAMRLRGVGPYSPVAGFVNNFQVDAAQATLDTDTFTYSLGIPFVPGPPERHHPVLLLRLERLGAVPNFPECEIILRNERGRFLLAFLPAVAGLAPGQSFFLYLAEDGSTYFARSAHDAGDPDLNPDSGPSGTYLPRHLARGALGQVRPRPGVRPVAHRLAVHRTLCCWDQPLQDALGPDEVACDPERGRFRFPPTAVPEGQLTVDFRFAITGAMGAGPFDRGELPDPTLTVSQVRAADHTTLQAAIDAAPDGAAGPIVIEVLDSRTYDEAISVTNRNFPGGLVVQAAALEMPVLRSPGGPVFDVGATSTLGNLTLDGLVLAGGNMTVAGEVAELVLRFTGLEPDSAALDFAPASAERELVLSHCVSGPITVSPNVAAVRLSDSIVRHPQAAVDDPAGHVAVSAAGAVDLERVTVLGEVDAGALLASNTILVGDLSVGDPAASCLRYSRHPKGTMGIPTFRSTSTFPIFLATRFAHPGFFHLHPNTSAAIRRGAEEGGEMGAFYQAGIPWREQNVRIKLEEYMPAGLRAVPVRVLPRARFSGALRI